MPRRRLIWLAVSLLIVALTWQGGRYWSAHQAPPLHYNPARSATATKTPGEPAPPRSASLRLSNTSASLDDLVESDHAILLENALIDTASSSNLAIPSILRAGAEPGAFIVQSRNVLDDPFRQELKSHGADVVAYIPNNACLVQASATQAQVIARSPLVRAVIPFEPYFKLKASLLGLALNSAHSGPDQGRPIAVKVLLFPGAEATALPEMDSMGSRLVGMEPSPFGSAFSVRIARSDLPAIAGLAGVQAIEPAHARAAALDLSRASIGVAESSTAPTNYLGLTGSNVLVCVADTGIDTNHPDLFGRVRSSSAAGVSDTNGHGTLVAGIIAGNGSLSATVANAPASSLPPVAGQFRGMAPATTLLSVPMDASAHFPSDAALQQTAADAKVLISNNSWVYDGSSDYDLAAASYDAAVRDASPGASGPQPVLFVFPAGNSGAGSNDGTGGLPATVQSPGTAKNVITVGALEQFRFVTNETWNCPGGLCRTNQPWLALTDSTNQVAGFSGRGNVGIGIEGSVGRFKPDVVAPGTFVVSTRSTQWDPAGFYSPSNALNFVADTNFFGTWSNLDSSLGPNYRFDSGTSLASAEVSGLLALMQEFLQQRLGRFASPALMKAMLINGARPLGGKYDLPASSATNFQGWGLVNLPASVPASLTNTASFTEGTFLFDQSQVVPLATGQSQTRYILLSSSARTQPLRVTLVWTDPPGNPAAAIKLVNDLDLVVTNLDTGEVFLGNHFAPGTGFSAPSGTRDAPRPDSVNNVECVLLQPPLATNYAVTVASRRINVNAVTLQPGVVQDYALVIRSGDGLDTNAMALLSFAPRVATAPRACVLTNQFDLASDLRGQLLLGQRVGAQAPLETNTVPLLLNDTNHWLTVGNSNQWRFYVFTNDSSFTNAAFLTFSPPPLASGRMALAGAPTQSPVTAEADIDLYVSHDPGLLQLNPDAILAADKSVSRGGTETILLTNAVPGTYYIGVKCESGLAGQFGLLALFSAEPFAAPDQDGNWILKGLPVAAPIPAGSPNQPGETFVFCPAPQEVPLRRVLVTNTFDHPSPPDLRAVLRHDGASVALANHAADLAPGAPVLFDDSAEGDLPGARPTDGPGSLRDFAGRAALGQWILTVSTTNQPGTNRDFSIFLETQPDLTLSTTLFLAPGASRDYFLTVPLAATNLSFRASLTSGQGPGLLAINPITHPSPVSARVELSSGALTPPCTLTRDSYPSLAPGLWSARLVNLGPDTASFVLQSSVLLDVQPAMLRFSSTAPLNIADDAVTTGSLLVPGPGSLDAAKVTVRLDHPRVSDLALTLVSPSGSRVLLCENRGGVSSAGLGASVLVTNTTPVQSTGGPEAVTNVIDTGQVSGVLTVKYDFYDLPDTMHVYYEGTRIWDSGLVSGGGSVDIPYGPGTSTFITIIMNENGSSDTNTVWSYTAISTRVASIGVTFTDDTNLASVPIKFALPPLTNAASASATPGIFYLPEQSLDALKGQAVAGRWTLEISDTRAGATNPPPRLLDWHLDLVIHPPDLPPAVVTLTNAVPFAVLAGTNPADSYRFVVSTNAQRAQFEILSPSADLTLLARYGLPMPSLDSFDLSSTNGWTNDELIVIFSGAPPVPLLPGDWYLKVLNPTGTPAGYSIKAAEWPTTGTNIVIIDQHISGSTVCLSWTSLPGAHYYLQASPDLTSGWSFISPSVTATGNVATLCVPAPPGSQFFAVREGLVLSSPLLASNTVQTANGVLLSWLPSSPIDLAYQAEWSASLRTPAWTPFTNLIHAVNGVCTFLDDGSQTGGLGQTRYYRIHQLPFGN